VAAAHAQAAPGASGTTVAAAANAKDPFVDPLDAPALLSSRLAGRPVMAVARAGGRLVAVGMRGLIEISDDEGSTWKQVGAPVRSDLLALTFPSATDGWAVGHDGVVLHTADAGRTWTRQLDGRSAAATLEAYYKQKIAAGETALQPFLDQLTLNYRTGPSLPLLSVWFRDAKSGMAVGPFGMAIATDDGGKTWRPMLERFDNPQFLHLNGVFGQGDDVYVAAEQGTVFRLDRATGRFLAAKSGYGGSFFGVTGDAHILLAYGLRGTIYRSADHGATWEHTPSPLHGAVTGATPLASGNAFVFVTAAGEASRYDERENQYRPLDVGHVSVITGVLSLSDRKLAVTSLAGPNIAPVR
jgi:photosystem II stability/assembly factor-like uncharacterized protein